MTYFNLKISNSRKVVSGLGGPDNINLNHVAPVIPGQVKSNIIFFRLVAKGQVSLEPYYAVSGAPQMEVHHP